MDDGGPNLGQTLAEEPRTKRSSAEAAIPSRPSHPLAVPDGAAARVAKLLEHYDIQSQLGMQLDQTNRYTNSVELLGNLR